MLESRWAKAHEALLCGYSGLNGSDVKLYLLMKLYAMDRGFAFPSQERLAKQMRSSVRSAQRGLQNLCDCGLLRIILVKGGKTNVYIVREPDSNNRDYQHYLKMMDEFKALKSKDIVGVTYVNEEDLLRSDLTEEERKIIIDNLERIKKSKGGVK